jgi:para-aminobenzoate synthetase component I
LKVSPENGAESLGKFAAKIPSKTREGCERYAVPKTPTHPPTDPHNHLNINALRESRPGIAAGRTPPQVLARWPVHRGLAVLWSGGDDAHARFTMLGEPSRTLVAHTAQQARDALDSLPPCSRQNSRSHAPAFAGGWMLSLSYELGGVLEPATASKREPGPWPLLVMQRIDRALVFDHVRQTWWEVGDGDLWRELHEHEEPFEVGEFASDMGREAYEQRVRRVLAYIRAGDVYQVNIAHRLRASFAGSTRGLFARLMHTTRPWMGAYLEAQRGAIASASPELFVEYSPITGRLQTRPMKGTRRGDGSERERDETASELGSSEKDRAELAMIVDLMRNDLGRVCTLGSVRVDAARSIELHGHDHARVLQATATVSGELAEHTRWTNVLEAIFPGGSVTGAPKIRAMQIIDELEPHPRGPYCGAIGYISDCGHAAFNIAIRTACIRDGNLDYCVGAGLVADSDPTTEWEETLIKARGMMSAASRDQ